MSRTGRASAFDQSADGYVRGEGGAVLLLKPLARAVADGDPIHAVIKGVATNHGGRTNSLTVTNPTAQANLIEGLYTRAGIRPETVSYIEAHGPGTPVGDPIEIMALKEAFRNLHAAQGTVARPESCGIGSVKTNIGHLEGAAGVAGIAKVISSLALRTLPANVNFRNQNRLIKLEDSPFHVIGHTRPWTATAPESDGTIRPRRAGVSSFGFGGTNAHVVLEEHLPDEADAGARDASLRGPELLPLSAKTPDRLRAVAVNLLTHLREHPSQALADIAHTLRAYRDPMPARVAFAVQGRNELEVLLREFTDGTRAVGELHLGGAVRGTAEEFAELRAAGTRWVQGEAVDWADRFGHGAPRPRRVRLPGYPFARERHWFSVPHKEVEAPHKEVEAPLTSVETPRTGAGAGATPPAANAAAAAHPLVHADTSGPTGHRYSSTFTGAEPFLASHVVGGARVFPAAAHVEMVRAAAVHAMGPDAAEPTVVRLRNVAWPRPLVVRDAPVEVGVRLTPQDGAALGFEVATGTDPAEVHSSGIVEAAWAAGAGSRRSGRAAGSLPRGAQPGGRVRGVPRPGPGVRTGHARAQGAPAGDAGTGRAYREARCR